MPDHARKRVGLGIVLMLMMVSGLAFAQTGQEFIPDEDGGNQEFDAVVAPLVVPTVDEFAAPRGEGRVAETGPLGISAYVDVTSDIQSGVLTPSYRVSRVLAFKAHIPLIFNYTRHYFGFDAEAGGIGDITLDAEFTRRMGGSGAELRLQGSVKLPTGDENKVDTDDFGSEYPVPLGTGAVDVLARAQYAWSSPNTGIIASALYRLNSGNEITTDFGSSIMIQKVTNADLGVLGLFGRRRMGGKWWLNLGATTMITGDGEIETWWNDGTPGSTMGMDQGGTLVDLFPGLTYDMGAFKPFFGARVPVVTNYDNDLRDDDRDAAFIFQVSYRPQSMME